MNEFQPQTHNHLSCIKHAVRKADGVADARLSGLHGQLESLRHLLDDPESREAIERVSEAVFPNGPLKLINAKVEDQVQKAQAALAMIEARFHKDLVRLKLVTHVKVTLEAHQKLAAALKLGTSGQGYAEVIAERAALQVKLRLLIALILVEYPVKDTARRAVLDSILSPILMQDEQVGNYLRRRVAIRDVDPATSQELPPLGEAGAVRP